VAKLDPNLARSTLIKCYPASCYISALVGLVINLYSPQMVELQQ